MQVSMDITYKKQNHNIGPEDALQTNGADVALWDADCWLIYTLDILTSLLLPSSSLKTLLEAVLDLIGCLFDGT